MTDERIGFIASKLRQASISCNAIPPITDIYDGLTIDDAYRIQMENVNWCINNGQIITGKKIGLTSKGIQTQLGVNEPDYGHLFQTMDFSDAGILSFDDFILPKIEGEVAFYLKENLEGGKVTVEDVYAATDYVVPAFEIVDSRVEDWKIQLIDTVADNASSGAYVLGDNKMKLSDIDLKNLQMKMYKNDVFHSEGVGSAVLGDPCKSVAWLSNRLWDYGVVLKAGEIVLSGAFQAAPEVTRGDTFRATFGELGTVEAKFI